MTIRIVIILAVGPIMLKPRIIKTKSYLNFNIVLNLNNYQKQMIFHG